MVLLYHLLFNGNRKKYLEIDFDKPHKGLYPHAHDCIPDESIRTGEGRPLQGKRERDFANRVLRMYEKHKNELLRTANENNR